MSGVALFVALTSLALFSLSLFSVYLMLYAWERPERLEASQAPREMIEPELSFTVLLPARHEQAVIYETVKRVWHANYPSHLLELVVVCSTDDVETIMEAQRAVSEIDSANVRVETFSDRPINKPHGLNVGLGRTSHQVVTIFDAEDDIDPDIFRLMNTVMVQTGAGVVQSGVQLMNYRDHWFSIHNCLEYFFWFKSRLHFHAAVGTIPLGGNTVFMKRSLIQQVGAWDEYCLTEDADIGFRLSTLGEPIRVVYDAQHVTREETPHTVDQLIRQRTRWQQGFLQVLGKGEWLGLSTIRQRLLAVFTLAYPLLQAVLLLLWPVAVVAVLWLKLPTIVAMLSFLPLYALAFQLLVTLVGMVVFTREYDVPIPVLMPFLVVVTFLPYQWVLGYSSLRAVYRVVLHRNNWEKTAHTGAHRSPSLPGAVPAKILAAPSRALVAAPAVSPATRPLVARLEPVMHELGDLLGMERRSLLVLDADSNSFSVATSRGRPDYIVETAPIEHGEGIVNRVVRERCPIIISAEDRRADLEFRGAKSAANSSIAVPIEEHGRVVAVLNLSTEFADASRESAVRRLTDFLHDAVDAPSVVPGLDKVVG